ncbi:hypothetical protein ACFQ10_01210 [Streptomyces indonesiensis]
MFRLSYNANGLRNLTIERAIEEVAEAGYDGIELSLHPRHIDPFDFTGDHATVVRKALERRPGGLLPRRRRGQPAERGAVRAVPGAPHR